MAVPFGLHTLLNSHNMTAYLDVENMLVGGGTSGMILMDLPPLTPVSHGLLGIPGG